MKSLNKYLKYMILIACGFIMLYLGYLLRYKNVDTLVENAEPSPSIPENNNQLELNTIPKSYEVTLEECEYNHLIYIIEFRIDQDITFYERNGLYYGVIPMSKKETIKTYLLNYFENNMFLYEPSYISKIEFKDGSGIFKIIFKDSSKENIDEYMYSTIDNYISYVSLYRKMLNINVKEPYIEYYDIDNNLIKEINNLQ